MRKGGFMKIALCPGHHDRSTGAINEKYGINEHSEANSVVCSLAEILTIDGHCVNILTGTLTEKVSKINKGSFDVALDIHFNAANRKAAGCEVMYVPGSELRRVQAAEISRVMSMYLGNRNRGANEGYYWGGSEPGMKPDYFLAKTNCPAFIPEPLFIDNNTEAEKWLVSGRHGDIAEAIALGVREMMDRAWVV